MTYRPIAVSFITFWSLAIAWVYLRSYSISFGFVQSFFSIVAVPPRDVLLDAGRSLGVVTWMWTFSYLAGRVLFGVFWGSLAVTRPERIMLSCALGWGALILMYVVLGLCGFLTPAVFAGSLLIGTLAAIITRRKGETESSAPRVTSGPAPSSPWQRRLVGIAIGLPLLFFLIDTLAPEIFYDSLVYHLASPHLWNLKHRIVGFPSQLFAASPSNIHVLYGCALLLAGATSAKLLHFSFGIATLVLIYQLAKRFGSARAGWTAVLIFFSSPIVMLQFSRTSIEYGTTLFALSACTALAVALSYHDGILRRRALLLAGIFCGLCMGTKYHAFVLFPALGLAIAVQEWSDPAARTWRRLVRDGLYFSVPVILVILPWLVRNMVVYHNPLYPLAHTLFPGSPVMGHPDYAALQADAGRSLLREMSSWRGAVAFFLEPWALSVKGWSDQDFLGPLFLILLPWLVWRWRPALRMPLIVFLTTWILLACLSKTARYRIPSLGLLAVLIAVALEDDQGKGTMRKLSYGLIGALAIINFSLAGSILWAKRGWNVVFGVESPGDYLSRMHPTYPTTYYPAAQYLNAHTPTAAKVLILGDARGYYVDRPYVASSIFDVNPMFHWANQSADGNGLYQRMREAGFTHILLNIAEAARLDFQTGEDLSAKGLAVFDQFWQSHLVPLFEDKHPTRPQDRFCVVYEIVNNRLALLQAPAVGPNYPVLIFQQRDRVRQSKGR